MKETRMQNKLLYRGWSRRLSHCDVWSAVHGLFQASISGC